MPYANFTTVYVITHSNITYDVMTNTAERVNGLYGGKKWKKRGGRGGNIFKVPEPLIPPAGARIMSLQVRYIIVHVLMHDNTVLFSAAVHVDVVSRGSTSVCRK
jgi:hypothetical protein